MCVCARVKMSTFKYAKHFHFSNMRINFEDSVASHHEHETKEEEDTTRQDAEY